jgi:diaminopimelate epimerase
VYRLEFIKMEGLGNDFIVVDGSRARITAAAAVRLCDRRRGIGGDGVLTVSRQNGRASMHVYNADGSVAEMCGNGLRCVVLDLAPNGEAIVVDTGGGERGGQVLRSGEVKVDLARATLIAEKIEARLGDERRAGIGISMGNPHLVLEPFPSGTDLYALAKAHGPALERHPSFPDRVNVGFVEVTGPRSARLVVFERGAGITDACGTGAGAAAVALLRKKRVEGPVEITLPGGKLIVDVEGDPTGATTLGRVAITGPAKEVYRGAIELAAEELVGAAS